MEKISYFYPQVPTLISVNQSLFSQLDKDADTVAELKINGTHLILKRFSNGSYEFWNRTGEKLQYRPSTEVLRSLDSLKWEGDCEVDGELEHTKVHSRKHTIMLHDVIIWNGELLTYKTFSERRKILESLFRDMAVVIGTVEKRDYGKLKNLSVYPAIQWKKDYKKIYDEYIKFEEVEGLVIKKLSALLKVGTRDCPIVSTMFKVRKPHKNYRF